MSGRYVGDTMEQFRKMIAGLNYDNGEMTCHIEFEGNEKTSDAKQIYG